MLRLRGPLPKPIRSTLLQVLSHRPHHHHHFSTMPPLEKKQEPAITSLTDLQTSDSKWVGLKQIRYTDAAGTPRTWEVAVRKTRSPPITTPLSSTVDSVAVDAVAMGNVFVHPSRAPTTLVVIQYRPPLDAYTVEWPAGLVDAGETAAQAAEREFREETGYSCEVVSVSAPQAADPGMTSATMRLVMVEVRLPEGEEGGMPEQRLDDGERIERVVVPLAELYDRLVEYSRRDRFIVAAKLFHFAAGMRFAQEQKYMKL
ncbi:NUDIX domain-containing protein [Camillea tinctor]|nr:NUDIX domain-containing protein [Camillea tinctor]